MATLTHKCPHPACLTEHIALRIVACTGLTANIAHVHLACPKCFGPSAARVRQDRPGTEMAQFVQAQADISGSWAVLKFWPEPPGPNVPAHLPPEVARIYLQGESNYSIKGNEEASGTMYRKALDVALKRIDASVTGTLKARIKALGVSGKLTADLAIWADSVRDLGNEAAHEENPPSREELEDLRSFTEMVMRYLFTLPNMIRIRRGEKLEWETDPAA